MPHRLAVLGAKMFAVLRDFDFEPLVVAILLVDIERARDFAFSGDECAGKMIGAICISFGKAGNFFESANDFDSGRFISGERNRVERPRKCD